MYLFHRFASGLIFVASSMFQAMGNTIPSLVASGVRIGLLSVIALFLARMPGFQLRWIWYLSVGTVLAQLAIAMWFLRRQFARRLRWLGTSDEHVGARRGGTSLLHIRFVL